MRGFIAFFAAAAAFAPGVAWAQHSHGAAMDSMPQREAPPRPAAPEVPRGVLPAGSPRQIDVLVLSYGFSPEEIRADQGEEVVLRVQRVDEVSCKEGLAIPARQILVKLPLGEAVPVTLKLDRAEKLEVVCANENVRTAIVVSAR